MEMTLLAPGPEHLCAALKYTCITAIERCILSTGI